MDPERQRLEVLIEESLGELRMLIGKYAEAERDYRKARARAWVETPRLIHGEKATVPEREAMVDAATADARFERDDAEGLKQSALEAVRNARQQLSAWQTEVKREIAELGLTKYGPNEP